MNLTEVGSVLREQGAETWGPDHWWLHRHHTLSRTVQTWHNRDSGLHL
uniref:Zinc finger protein 548 n=1 Tax=Homo sapiens TaxID=9606 RepID=M0R2J6_HUMAN